MLEDVRMACHILPSNRGPHCFLQSSLTGVFSCNTPFCRSIAGITTPDFLLYENWKIGYCMLSHFSTSAQVDLLLGTWAEQNVATLTQEEMDSYEDILNLETVDIFNFITGNAEPPAFIDNAMMARLQV